jgi:hypothetical protein
MNLSELVKVLSSEEKAEEFLSSRVILKTFEKCISMRVMGDEDLSTALYKCSL